MAFDNLLTVDFLPMIAAWGSIYAIIYSVKEDPKGLKEIADLKERHKTRQAYLNNHVSVYHAVIMCILSTYPSI